MSTSSGYHHGDLRNALLETASHIAAEGDPDALTLRAVARRAGVSHAAAYRHFADKRDLLQALALRGFAALGDAMASAGDGAEPTLADVAAAYVRFARGHRVEFRLMYDRALCAPPGAPDPLADAGARALAGLEEFLGTRCGVPADVREDAALAVLSQMHGLATLILETPALKDVDDARADALARRCADFLVLGDPARGARS
ncbi:TetR/AcrR family transcriptional regulator [Microbacter sp. GSS18]|nr:TetR/AcrR family transcriptional regulator [Microbacter sp. GSS18]